MRSVGKLPMSEGITYPRYAAKSVACRALRFFTAVFSGAGESVCGFAMPEGLP